MIKTYNYKGVTFYIEVRLKEKKIDDSIYYTMFSVVSTENFDGRTDEKDIRQNRIELEVKKEENVIKKHIDEKLDVINSEKILLEMGFK